MIRSSSDTDTILSTDSSFTSGASGTGSLSWGGADGGSWIGRTFAVKFGSSSQPRTITITVNGSVVASTDKVFSAGVSPTRLILAGQHDTLAAFSPAGVASAPFALYLGDSAGRQALPVGASGVVTVSCPGGTVTLVRGSWTFDRAGAEAYFTITPNKGAASPLKVNISHTISGPSITVPTDGKYEFAASGQSSVITAPPTILSSSSDAVLQAIGGYFGAYTLKGNAGQVNATPSDSLGRTFLPKVLNFQPEVSVIPFRLTVGPPFGNHTVTVTNNAAFPTPAPSIWRDALRP